MQSQKPDRPTSVTAYTVCLYIISAVALMSIASHQMLIVMVRQDEPNAVTIAVLRFLQAFELILFAAALSVAILRSRKSPLAGATTAAVSILLIIWVPFGTAMFIWWVGWVRHREATTPRRQFVGIR